MSENLEQSAKRLAEQVRQRVIDEVKRQKNADTNTVEFQGFNADGKQLVKDGNEVRAIRETGNVSLPRGTKLIEDSESSVDSPRTKPRPAPTPQIRDFLKREDKPFRAKDPLLQQQELGGGSENEYWVNVRPCPPRMFHPFNYEYELGAGNGAYMYFFTTGANSPYDTDHVNTTYTGTNFTAQKRDDLPGDNIVLTTSTYPHACSAIAGAHASISQFAPASSGQAKVQCDGATINRPLPTTYLGTTYYEGRAIIHRSKFTSGSTFGCGCLGSSNNLTAASLPKYAGYVSVVARSQAAPLEEFPYYYYQTYNKELQQEISFTINILALLPAGSKIVRCERIHNYYRKAIDITDDSEILMNYAIYLVVLTDDFRDEVEIGDGVTNATGNTMKACMGRLSHKVIHTEIDLTKFATFNVRVNALNPYAGNTNSMVYNTTGENYPLTYLFPNGALHYSEVYGAGQSIFTKGNNIFTTGIDMSRRGLRFTDPTPIFTNAFAKDWVSQVNFNTSGFDTDQFSHWARLLEFLSWGENARFLGTFAADNAIEKPFTNCSGFYNCYDYKVTNGQVDLSAISTIADVIDLVENQTETSGCQGAQFDFQGEDFREYYGVRELGSYYFDPTDKTLRTQKYSLPDVGDFPVVEKESTGCGQEFTTGEFPYYGNYLGGEEMQFHQINQDYYHTFLPITSYSASNGVVTFRTKYLHAFVPGDSLIIGGTGVFDSNNVTAGADTLVATTTVAISASVPDTGTTPLSGAYVALI